MYFMYFYFPSILGEKIFGIPNLKPLIIPEVTIETDLVKMKANDVTIIGMETARLGYVK